MDSCRAVENEFDKAVKKLSINTVGIEKVISKLTAFRDELKNGKLEYLNDVLYYGGPLTHVHTHTHTHTTMDSIIYYSLLTGIKNII